MQRKTMIARPGDMAERDTKATGRNPVMGLESKRILICNCEGTMDLDGAKLSEALSLAAPLEVHHALCREELDRVAAAAREAGESLVIACTQEGVTFSERLAADGIETTPRLTNIRERAGWSDEGGDALAKIAALLDEATLDLSDVPTVAMESQGICLVYGGGERAVEVARQLASRLSVSLLLTDTEGVLPLGAMELMVSRGVIAGAAGHLGNFEVFVNGFAPLRPSSRDTLSFDLARDGAASRCDVILDISGRAPIFPAHEKRDGYLRADPDDPVAVQKALFSAVDLVGEFEKPRYVTFSEDLCAHSRSKITGCTRCLDVCPASAIQSDGDVVAIDPYICGGCGACNSVCPTGAAAYTYPPNEELLSRLRVLLARFAVAGGGAPVVLFHDRGHGWPLIEAMARFGPGLPASLLPVEVNEVTQLGLDVFLSTLAYGAERLVIIASPRKKDEFAGLAEQIGYCEAIMSGLGYESGLVTLLSEDDPDLVGAALYEKREIAPRTAGDFLPQAGKRANLHLAASHLRKEAPNQIDLLPLAPGAPFGAVAVDTQGCTLCLACVSACPTGALGDNPDLPQLSFQEEACIQCGLCRNTCPEGVIALEPRFNFSSEVKDRSVLYEEEPFLCVSCGKPFATKGTIEKMVETLAGKHYMFQGEAAERLKMCEDCRVIAQFETKDQVMASGERPRTRTTEDYLAAREAGRDEDDV